MFRVIVEQIVSADGYAEDAEGAMGFLDNAMRINEADTKRQRMLSFPGGSEVLEYGVAS